MFDLTQPVPAVDVEAGSRPTPGNQSPTTAADNSPSRQPSKTKPDPLKQSPADRQLYGEVRDACDRALIDCWSL